MTREGPLPAAPFHADVADAPAGAEAFWLTTADGIRLRAVAWRGGRRGTAVIFPGRTEFAEKYGRVAARLVERGLSVLVIDWRGQGLSDRYPANPMLGHIEDFRAFQLDVAALLELDGRLELPGPRYMLAHSMGGCIGLRTLLERADFCGAILSAPMWHLQMRAATRELTAKMTRLANLAGFGNRLMPGTKPQPTAIAIGYAGNPLTSDADVFAWCLGQITRHPELALGGPSMQWTYAALEEMARLYVAPLPRVPMLVMLGSEETVVSASIIRSQVAKMAEGALLELPGARHEIFMERPEIQAAVWKRIDEFLSAVPARRSRTPAV
ncbi:alpha/beta fold hydrolase [Amaricoccus sp.]|uniref:alpha/beta fold hydrolase n=1 Tax=Amaricoccus sp. TaxID=1872485 RepID=UPI002623B483|nr:alpha/beta hydrolase [Amaricoccus sp.]HRO10136.1 alpha/beta hydrolase [Amaricoccus sp.]